MVFQEDAVKRMGEGFQGFFPFGGLEFAFPKGNRVPSHIGKFLLHFTVAFAVAGDFPFPEIRVGFWHYEEAAPLMPVPEATVHEHARAVFRQHDIRFSRQSRMIQSVSESVAPQIFPHDNLRLRIFAVYRRHIAMALFGSEVDGHGWEKRSRIIKGS